MEGSVFFKMPFHPCPFGCGRFLSVDNGHDRCLQAVVTTDASSMGWDATCNVQVASGLWMGPRLLWHINCLELLAVHLALQQFWALLLGKHVLVPTDNTVAVSYINRLGGL